MNFRSKAETEILRHSQKEKFLRFFLFFVFWGCCCCCCGFFFSLFFCLWLLFCYIVFCFPSLKEKPHAINQPWHMHTHTPLHVNTSPVLLYKSLTHFSLINTLIRYMFSLKKVRPWGFVKNSEKEDTVKRFNSVTVSNTFY